MIFDEDIHEAVEGFGLLHIEGTKPSEEAHADADDFADAEVILYLLDGGGELEHCIGFGGGGVACPLLTTGDGAVNLGYLLLPLSDELSRRYRE